MHVQLRQQVSGERRGGEPRTCLVVRHAEHVEDGAELPVLVAALEQRLPADDLRHDAPQGPGVDRRAVETGMSSSISGAL